MSWYNLSIAGHSEAEAKKAIETVKEAVYIAAPLFRAIYDKNEKEHHERIQHTIIEMFVKLYSAGWHMGEDEESEHLDRYREGIDHIKEKLLIRRDEAQ